MKTKYVLLILLFAVVTINGQSTKEKVDDFLSTYNEYKIFNGTALVYFDGETILNKGYGYANLEFEIPNDPDVKFRIGSISKQFTAAVILKLVEEGKIKLDGHITDYLPDYRKDTGSKVTIHQLLTHTSGIPSYTNIPNLMSDSSRNRYSEDYFVEHFLSGDLLSEPGKEWAYNNSGFYLLAVIAERVSGKKFSDLLAEYILNPLDMKSSGNEEDTEIRSKAASGYNGIFSFLTKAPYIYMPNALGAGQMYSTTGDMLAWHKSLIHSDILSKESTEKMLTPYMNNYGYGIGIDTIYVGADSLKRTMIAHSGGINGFTSYYVGLLEDETAIILLTNMYRPDFRGISSGILDILYGKEPQLPSRPINTYIMERLTDADLETVLDEVRSFHNEGNTQYDIAEGDINMLGYAFIQDEKLDDAANIFQLNIELFPESANTYDSMGEAYMLMGEKEKAIEFYLKSLELNPGNQNAVMMLKKMGVEYERPEVSVPENLLRKYEGTYELEPEFTFTVRTEDGNLFVKATGQEEIQIFPETESLFYLEVVEAKIEFITDEDGSVNELILYQNGMEMPGKKTE